MKQSRLFSGFTAEVSRLAAALAAASIGLALSAAPAWSQAIEPEADAILRAMTDQLKGTT